MDMDFNGDVASLNAEILQLPEVSRLAIKTNPHVAEKLFDQWLSLPDTVSLDDGILAIPIVADPPHKLRTKKGLAVEFHDRVYAFLTIATMSGGCQRQVNLKNPDHKFFLWIMMIGIADKKIFF